MTWHVGQRVACIGDNWANKKEMLRQGLKLPEKGKIYTIHSISAVPEYDFLFFTFVEIRNPQCHFTNGYMEPNFGSVYFRPLVESRLDVFRAMLIKPKVNV